MRNIALITAATILFCLAIGFDISPFLRGPSPYPPEWRWGYEFVNTAGRLYTPVGVAAVIIGIFALVEKQKFLRARSPAIVLVLLILVSFFFQLSLLFYSRSGILVLVHRIINPQLNGYFTAALSIHNISEFLRTYNTQVLHFVYHAKAHPPGAILLFYFINQAMTAFPLLGNTASHFVPSHTDVKLIWNTLLPAQKAGALFAAFFIPFLSTLTLIPLYYSAKILYGSKVAMRSVCLFVFIPSIVFFIPINDSFLHVFSITAFFFLLKGIEKSKGYWYVLSGATLFLGVFFNLSLLPLLVFLVFFFLSKSAQTPPNLPLSGEEQEISRPDKRPHEVDSTLVVGRLWRVLNSGVFFFLGFLLLPILLFLFFQFSFIQVAQTIMAHVPDVHTRSYWIWIFYNLYDFLVFSGIPITIVVFVALKQLLIDSMKKQWKQINYLLVSFLLMIFILNFSGSVRGETGRLWSVYMPFMTLIAVAFVTNKLKFSTRFFTIFLLLQVIQILVMQEFWVMLW